MNVLVTGGLGVNGSWVTRKLVERGLRPVVLDLRADFSLLGTDLVNRIQFIECDIGDVERISQIMGAERIDSVVHMAAAVGHGVVDPDPKRTFDLNTYATVKLLEASKLARVKRLVFTSSRAVYGAISGEHAHPTYMPVDEDFPLRPRTLYDSCKVASEAIGRAYAAAGDMTFASLRFATIYGPGKTLRHNAFGVVSRIIEQPINGKAVSIERGGDQRDDLIFAEDAAEGVVLTLLSERLGYSEYNISTGTLHSLSDVAEAVKKHVPSAEISIGAGLNFFGDGPNYSCLLDNRRAVEDLGFRPEASLDVTIGRYYEAMQALSLPPFNR
jgi:UDP-glucose 4-epimerase